MFTLDIVVAPTHTWKLSVDWKPRGVAMALCCFSNSCASVLVWRQCVTRLLEVGKVVVDAHVPCSTFFLHQSPCLPACPAYVLLQTLFQTTRPYLVYTHLFTYLVRSYHVPWWQSTYFTIKCLHERMTEAGQKGSRGWAFQLLSTTITTQPNQMYFQCLHSMHQHNVT